jgi:uncharacterized protein
LQIVDLIWLDEIREKIVHKHHVEELEVVEIFHNRPYYRFVERGHHQGEEVYSALGRTQAGRLLIVFFVYKENHEALIISARDVTKAERKRYEQK